MKLWILAVGSRMPEWVNEGFAEYAKRMPPEARIELLEIKPEKRSANKSTQHALEIEKARILASLPGGCDGSDLVALDEKGKSHTTLQLAAVLKKRMDEGRNLALIIGGADGLHASLKKEAGQIWSLSNTTLPHGLVRVLLAEQLYRAVSLLKGHPYHRGEGF
jgi:23S rRNA (pseudouridine1915-N3)-methyltransferase